MELTDLNIIGCVKRSDIKGDVPKEAQFALVSNSTAFIIKFYKFGIVKFNDNTSIQVMMYWGEQGGWHNSSYNSSERNKLSDAKFLKIVD